MSKLYACIISGDAKKDEAVLLSIAREFSFGIEMLEDGVLFDVSGLENLIGNTKQIIRKITRQLEINYVSGNAAVADTPDTAILLARCSGEPDFAADTTDKFLQLRLRDLEIDHDAVNVFSDLGIHTIHDLQQIPREELIKRYGQEFKNVIDIIEQKGRRLLKPNVKESQASWNYQLDFPVDDFEQLIFIVNHGLDKLLAEVAYHALSTEQLDISFGLPKKLEKSYEVKTAFPTLEKTFWLKLINLRISLDPPESEIVAINIVSHFTKPRPTQKGLYAVSRPEPESLLLTVNKLKKLVGEDNVGVAVLRNQRLAEAFTLDAEKIPKGKECINLRSENSLIAFSYFNPPLPAEVYVEDKRLIFIKTPDFNARVEKYSGVWKGNSHWWNTPWETWEWDIEVENKGVYRLRKMDGKWFLAGEYD